jgi:putative thioredoxin
MNPSGGSWRHLSSAAAGPTLSAGPPGAVEAAAAAQAQQAAPYIIDVTDADFMQRVIAPGHKTPILLDCHAEWCGPCKELAPVLEKVVRSYDGRLILAKMDVDQSPQVANQMQIKSIPLLAGFRHAKMPDGREGMTLVGSVQGAPSEEELRKFIEEKLGLEPPQASPEQLVAAAVDVLEQGDAAAAVAAFNNALTVAAELGQDDIAADATAGMLRCYMALADTDPQAAAATDQVVKMLQTDPLKAYADRTVVSQALVRAH